MTSSRERLTIGPETMVMNFRPDEPMHNRYAVDHGFLSAKTGAEAVTIAQTVNAFFRWEFNSCEMLVQGNEVLPIDYANACPDVAVTSLHYYFPWAMRALVKWSAFCVATGRTRAAARRARPWFAVADDEDLSYDDKLAAYQQLADDYFDKERYDEFCAKSRCPTSTRWSSTGSRLAELRPAADRRPSSRPTPSTRWISSSAHFRGLLGLWISDQPDQRSATGQAATTDDMTYRPARGRPG